MDNAAKMQHAREGLRAKHLDEARAQFERLGVTPTSDQLAEAGDRLLKQGMRDRLALARTARWKNEAERREAKRVADYDHAIRQAHTYADLMHSWDPTIDDSTAFRLLVITAAEELEAPDGYSPARLVKRLQAYVDRAKAEAQAQSQRLTTTLPALDLEGWSTGDLTDGAS